MSGTHELQERYSSLVLAKLRKVSIFSGLFNKRYEGNPKAGAVKIPKRDTEVAVADYDITKGGTLTTSTTTYITLPIDQDRYVNELIDGYEAAAVPDNLIADRLDSAGYSMGLDVDTKLVNLLVTNGTSKDSSSITPENAYSDIVDEVQALKKKGMNVSELWLAVSNEMYGVLLKSPEFIKAKEITVLDGSVGRIAGLPVYETNNFPDGVAYIIGNNVFCHYVAEWSVPVGVKDLQDGSHIGASALQGRQVYGMLISRPDTVIVKKTASLTAYSVEEPTRRRTRA